MCCACLPRFCVASHVLCSVMYIGVGAVQLVAGIFFLISLPVFKVGSNVWTGVWNVVVGVGGAVFSSVGDLSPSKHRILLYLTITVLVLNLINLVVLELGEWRILMPDKVKATLQNHNLQTLVLYARMTTSISSALAVIIAFVDAQFMFCWLEHTLRPHSPLDHKETVSDIEYIIPRAKSGSMGKNNPHNLFNQYAAQSWVFDTDTVGSSHSTEAPYGKLQQFTNSKTVVLRRKSNTNSNKLAATVAADDSCAAKDHLTDNDDLNDLEDETANRLKPVVLVEGISNDERHLQFMTSFSRTPSPQPNSDSSSPCSNPAPIYECLERLTEPSVYRSRLNTALEATVVERRPSPSVSPRPHSVVASDQEQYASLMVELERTIVAKFPPQGQADSLSQPLGTTSQHKHSASDADFSRELEAALQLIQDLESPNTAETPSDAPQMGFHQASELASTSTSAANSKAHNDRTYHLMENSTRSNEEDMSSGEEDNTWSSSSHEALHKPIYNGKDSATHQHQLLHPGAKSALKRKHTTVIRIRDGRSEESNKGIDETVEDVNNRIEYNRNQVQYNFLNNKLTNNLLSTGESLLIGTNEQNGVVDDKVENVNKVKHDENLVEYTLNNNSSISRLPSIHVNRVSSSSLISNCHSDSGVILEYSNSEESIHSGSRSNGVVVKSSSNGVVPNGNCTENHLQEFTVIREEETDECVGNGEDKRIANGGGSLLKNGGGAVNNGGAAGASSSSSSTSRSNSLKRSLSSVTKWRMFPKKRTARFVLTPELESTILKSESLLHLTEVELVARYDRNKSIQRRIEEKAWQKIIGASNSDSTC